MPSPASLSLTSSLIPLLAFPYDLLLLLPPFILPFFFSHPHSPKLCLSLLPSHSHSGFLVFYLSLLPTVPSDIPSLCISLIYLIPPSPSTAGTHTSSKQIGAVQQPRRAGSQEDLSSSLGSDSAGFSLCFLRLSFLLPEMRIEAPFSLWRMGKEELARVNNCLFENEKH